MYRLVISISAFWPSCYCERNSFVEKSVISLGTLTLDFFKVNFKFVCNLVLIGEFISYHDRDRYFGSLNLKTLLVALHDVTRWIKWHKCETDTDQED